MGLCKYINRNSQQGGVGVGVGWGGRGGVEGWWGGGVVGWWGGGVVVGGGGGGGGGALREISLLDLGAGLLKHQAVGYSFGLGFRFRVWAESFGYSG